VRARRRRILRSRRATAKASRRCRAHARSPRDSSGPWDEPIRVFNINDALALQEATGMEVLYRYGEVNPNGRYLRLYVALEDPESKIERNLSFDMLDSLYRIRNEDDLSGYPGYRRALREILVKSLASGEDEVGKDLQAAMGLARRDRPDQARGAACARPRRRADCTPWRPGSRCARRSRQWLRGWPGRRDPALRGAGPGDVPRRARARLRGGHRRRKDMDAAMVLLDAAEKRWPRDAYASFAEQWSRLSNLPLPAAAMTRLEKAGKEGSARAAIIHLYCRVAARRATSSMRPGSPRRRGLAEAGNRGARELLFLPSTNRRPAFRACLARARLGGGRRGGAAGLACAAAGQDRLAQAARRSADARSAQAVRRGCDALDGRGGRAPRTLEGSRILSRSGAVYEDADALLALLDLYAEAHPGLSRGRRTRSTSIAGWSRTCTRRRSGAAMPSSSCAPATRAIRRSRASLLQGGGGQGRLGVDLPARRGTAINGPVFGKVETEAGAWRWLKQGDDDGKSCRQMPSPTTSTIRESQRCGAGARLSRFEGARWSSRSTVAR
jgi:hypothetical protein